MTKSHSKMHPRINRCSMGFHETAATHKGRSGKCLWFTVAALFLGCEPVAAWFRSIAVQTNGIFFIFVEINDKTDLDMGDCQPP